MMKRLPQCPLQMQDIGKHEKKLKAVSVRKYWHENVNVLSMTREHTKPALLLTIKKMRAVSNDSIPRKQKDQINNDKKVKHHGSVAVPSHPIAFPLKTSRKAGWEST
jgi:hypothetical protein